MKVWKLTHSDLYGYCAYKDVKEILDELECMEPECSVVIECLEMTEEEYHQLPEFQGW